MTTKHNKAWRTALKSERGIAAEMIESKIVEAWEHPNIHNEDIEDAKLAFQRSYLLFVQSVDSGNALLRELSMTEGQRAFDCGKLLHTKMTLDPEVSRDRARQAGTRKPRNDELQTGVNRLVARFPDLSATELWQKASTDIQDQIGFDRFRKRVTEARRLGRK